MKSTLGAPAAPAKGPADMTDARPVLIASADAALCDSLADHLATAGFAPVVADTTAALTAVLIDDETRCDGVILDISLPGGDGSALCTDLRRQGIQVPLLLLGDSTEEQVVVRSLDAGADDYLTKPVRMAELLARLRARIRLFADSENAVLPLGPYIFHPAAKLLQQPARNRRIRLTDKEMRILKYLYRANARVLRQTLLNEVWGYNTGVTTHTLETHIYRLRQKIEADPGNPSLLLTGDGGYRLATGQADVTDSTTTTRGHYRVAA
jgi:DNA-binding response OmpR family regulator